MMEQRVLKMKDVKVREESGSRYLDGYFAIFGQSYNVFDGWVETIAPGAFARTLAGGGDVKALWNHDSNIVLGSTSNRTLTLSEDDVGLKGSIQINENDQEALNAYARVSRGDVDGCSFGFEIKDMEEWWDEDGIYHTRITEVDPLYEISPCTFPPYTSTSISARNKEHLTAARERLEAAAEEKRNKWREEMRARLKGE